MRRERAGGARDLRPAGSRPDRAGLSTSEGDGLHCLKELRRRDAKVPIIAISGAASAKIARELVECGADDYLNKSDLSGRLLAKSVREVLIAMGCLEKNGLSLPIGSIRM